MEQHYIPKYLHAYPQFLWWELDEFMFLAGFIFLGIMVGKMITMTLVGVLAVKIYTKLKYRKQDGFIIHFFYMLGLYNPKGKKVPPYWVKELLS